MNFLKKSVIILLTFFYSVCAVGMQVKVHYCHGKISSVSLDFSKADCCCEKSKKPKKCCSDKEVALKIDSKNLQTTEKKTASEKVVFASLSNTVSFSATENYTAKSLVRTVYQVPHFYTSQRYLKCCVFRI